MENEMEPNEGVEEPEGAEVVEPEVDTTDRELESSRAAIAELGTADPKMSGRVIGQVMKAGAGTVDGSLVNRLVREELSG